jgi:hypothetical protein
MQELVKSEIPPEAFLDHHILRPLSMLLLTFSSPVSSLDAIVDHHGQREGLWFHAWNSDVEEGRSEE